MNVLAHLHLASLTNSSFLGNTVADFVRGDPYLQYSKQVADGIMFHRQIDVLTDVLPAVKQAKSLFIDQHKRVALITLDIVWDHFLSLHWHQFCPNYSVAEFNQQVKAQIQPVLLNCPEDYQIFMTHLWADNWLENYADLTFIKRVLNGMANRRPKLAMLRETFFDIEQNYHQLKQHFFDFYPCLLLPKK